MGETSAHELTNSGDPCITPGCQGLSNTYRGAYKGLCVDCRTGQSPAQVMNRTLGTPNPREDFLLNKRGGRSRALPGDTTQSEAPGAPDPEGQAEGDGARQPSPSPGSLAKAVRRLVPTAEKLDKALAKRRDARDESKAAIDELNAQWRTVREQLDAMVKT